MQGVGRRLRGSRQPQVHASVWDDKSFQPTLATFVQALADEDGITIVGDLQSGSLQITAYRGEPVDPPITWHITPMQFEAELLEVARHSDRTSGGLPTPRDGMQIWGTNFDEWLEDEVRKRCDMTDREPWWQPSDDRSEDYRRGKRGRR